MWSTLSTRELISEENLLVKATKSACNELCNDKSISFIWVSITGWMWGMKQRRSKVRDEQVNLQQHDSPYFTADCHPVSCMLLLGWHREDCVEREKVKMSLCSGFLCPMQDWCSAPYAEGKRQSVFCGHWSSLCLRDMIGVVTGALGRIWLWLRRAGPLVVGIHFRVWVLGCYLEQHTCHTPLYCDFSKKKKIVGKAHFSDG